jgi:hypothetical protein
MVYNRLNPQVTFNRVNHPTESFFELNATDVFFDVTYTITTEENFGEIRTL